MGDSAKQMNILVRATDSGDLSSGIDTSAGIACVAGDACAETIVLGTNDGRLLYSHLDRKIEIRLGYNPVVKVAINPSRPSFCAALLANGDAYVAWAEKSRNSMQSKKLRVPRGDQGRSIFWLQNDDDQASRSTFLLGTSRGNLYLVECGATHKLDERTELIFRADGAPVYGIFSEKIADSTLLVLATASKILHLVRKGKVVDVARDFSKARVYHAPLGHENVSLRIAPKLEFLGKTTDGVPPRTFVWATEKATVSVAEIDVVAEAKEPDQGLTSAVLNGKVIDLERVDVNEIVDLSLSSLHVLVMTRTKLFACKRLTGKLAKEKDLSNLLTREGPLSYHGVVGLNRDVAAGRLRFVTEDGRVFDGYLEREFNGAWKDAADEKRFDLAMLLTDDRNAVAVKQADFFASQGDWSRAVKHYAKTDKSIEEVLLSISEGCSSDINLMYLHQIDYLVRRLETVPKSDATQRSLIALLLVEMYSSRITMLSPEGNATEIAEEFTDFLLDNYSDLPLYPAVKVLTAHGRYDEASLLAARVGEVPLAMRIHLKLDDTQKALRIFSENCDREDFSYKNRAEALHLVAPEAARRYPMQLVQLWTQELMNPYLEATTLTSALLEGSRYQRGVARAECITALKIFLERVLKTPGKLQLSRDYWVRLLIAVFCEFQDEERVSEIIHSEGQYLSTLPLGLLVGELQRLGFHRLCVYIYGTLGLHEEAVDIALYSDDLNTAEEHALEVFDLEKGSRNHERARKLWMRIVQKSPDDVIDIVSRSRGCIRIEDVLPTTSGFNSDQISAELKEALVSSLKEHLSAASDARGTAENLIVALDKIRQRSAAVERHRDQASAQQNHSGQYLFPCGHCLRTVAQPYRGCPACGRPVIDMLDAEFSAADDLSL